MKRKLMTLFHYTIFIALGYSLAIMVSRCELKIGYPDNRYVITQSIFPFSRTTKLPPSFNCYFHKNKCNTQETLYIGTRALFSFFDPEAITLGGQYVRNLSALYHINKFNLSNEQRDCILSNYYYLTKTGNLFDVDRYVQELRARFRSISIYDDISIEFDLSIPKEIFHHHEQ